MSKTFSIHGRNGRRLTSPVGIGLESAGHPPAGAVAATFAGFPRWGRTAFALGLWAIAVYVVAPAFALAAISPTLAHAIKDWLFLLPLMLAFALCVGRVAIVPVSRGAWLLIAVGIAMWCAGFTYRLAILHHLESLPYPSPADVFWLGAYLPFYGAVMLLVRDRVAKHIRVPWLEGILGALVVSTLAATFLYEPIIEATGGTVLATAANLAYPLGDLALVGFLGIVWLVAGRSLGRSWPLLILAFAFSLVADTYYLVASISAGESATYPIGGVFDACWAAMTLTLGWAAWQRPPAPGTLSINASTPVVTPALCALTGVGLLVYGNYADLNAVAGALAAVTLMVAGGRTVLGYLNRSKTLNREVAERTRALESSRLETLRRLALAAEYRDDDTYRHTERIGYSAWLLARELGASEEEAAIIRYAAPLHDIGKIAISDAILLKPGRLTDEQQAAMRQHVTAGARILAGSRSPVLRMAETIALRHHERWDGRGYPDGFSGERIPWVARIVAVADVFDALTHERPYKHAWTVGEAVAEIRAQSGRQFDPAVVAAFEALDHEALAGTVATAPLEDDPGLSLPPQVPAE